MSALKFTNPITALWEMAQRRSNRQANNQTISESLQRIKVGEYIDKHGNPSLALMVDGIAIRLVTTGTPQTPCAWCGSSAASTSTRDGREEHGRETSTETFEG